MFGAGFCVDKELKLPFFPSHPKSGYLSPKCDFREKKCPAPLSAFSPRQQIWNGIEVEHMGKAKVVCEVQNSLNSIQVPLLKRRFLSRGSMRQHAAACGTGDQSLDVECHFPPPLQAKRHQCQEAIAEMLRNLIVVSSIGNHKHRDPLWVRKKRSDILWWFEKKKKKLRVRVRSRSLSLSLSRSQEQQSLLA